MRDLTHLTQKLTRHEESKKHMDNMMKLCVLGKVNIASQLDEGHRASVRRHNQEVDNNRYILSRIIDCLRLCGSLEASLRGHDESEDSENRGVFRTLIDFMASSDAALQVHLQEATVFKGLSKTIQNELLDCMLTVARDHIKQELKHTSFVSVEADDTTDVTTVCQSVLIFRYIPEDGVPVERFYGFTPLKDARAETIATALLKHLEELFPEDADKEKLIAQSYDGASVMRGEHRGVQRRIQDVFHNAHYVHCYAHQLNLVMQKAASHVKDVRVFFKDLSAMPTFFSRSPKRTEVLDQVVGRRLPRAVPTRWNFHIRTVCTIFEKRQELIECFHTIRDSDFDAVTTAECRGLLSMLEDKVFLYWLSLFSKIMPHVDVLYHQLQRRITDPVLASAAIRDFVNAIENVRGTIGTLYAQLPPVMTLARRISKETLDRQASEICSLIINGIEVRFAFTRHLSGARLLDPSLYHTHSQSFPEETLDEVVQAYPMLEKDRLKAELKTLYERQELYSAKGAMEILQMLIENNMQDTFVQLVKLLRIVITTPLTTAEAERAFSAMKRVKTFLRNTMGEERLNALAMLSVERKMIGNIPDFNTKVIELFATQKDRRAQFMYKK